MTHTHLHTQSMTHIHTHTQLYLSEYLRKIRNKSARMKSIIARVCSQTLKLSLCLFNCDLMRADTGGNTDSDDTPTWTTCPQKGKVRFCNDVSTQLVLLWLMSVSYPVQVKRKKGWERERAPVGGEREREREREEQRGRERERERERLREKAWNRESGEVRVCDAGGYRRDDKGRKDGGRDAHGRTRGHHALPLGLPSNCSSTTDAASQSPWGSVSCLGVTANRCLRRLRDAGPRLLFPGG
jgi:hypothetical protein